MLCKQNSNIYKHKICLDKISVNKKKMNTKIPKRCDETVIT